MRGGRSRDQDAIAHPYRAAIAGEWFPYAAGIDTQSLRPFRHDLRLIDFRETRQMVAEITRCGEKRGLTIFIAAIAGDRLGLRQSGIDEAVIFLIECELEDLQIIRPVLALAEPRANYDASNRFLLEHPARRDIADRDTVLGRHFRRGIQDFLQGLPASDRLDEAQIFHRAPVGDLGRP